MSSIVQSIHVRRASSLDAPVIAALIALFVPGGTLLPRSEEFIAERTNDFLVAMDGGRIVGCAHLEEYAPSLAELRSLAVDPEGQGRGIGAALVDAIEQLARRREYSTLFAVSNRDTFFLGLGYLPQDIPELDRERSEVSKFKGVFAKELSAPRHG
jgi:amino-acid N-acetyltransferase